MIGCAVLIRMGVPLADAYRAVRQARGESVSLSDEQVAALEAFAKFCQGHPRWDQQRGVS